MFLRIYRFPRGFTCDVLLLSLSLSIHKSKKLSLVIRGPPGAYTGRNVVRNQNM